MQYTVFYTDTWSGDEGTAQYTAASLEQASQFFYEDFGNTATVDQVIGINQNNA